ncbi:MAG: DJ-1/PfpI family protein [Bacteroidota bacterium]
MVLTSRRTGESGTAVRIAFYIPPQVHILDVCGPIHVFYEARDMGLPIELRFLSAGALEVESSSGLFFSRLEPFADVELGAGDFLFIPGLIHELWKDDEFHKANRAFYSWVKERYAEGVKLAAVCTGSFLLAETGLLNGRSCTTHWRYTERMGERFKEAAVVNNRLFVEEEGIFTSAGVSSGIDLALYLLERIYDTALALRVAREVVIYIRRGEEDPQVSIFLQYRNHLDERVHKVQDVISNKLEEKHPIEELADVVNTSPRNLTRLFKKTTGITVGEYIDKLRVERAQQLLQTGQKVDYIASQIGYADANQLRAVLRKYKRPLPSHQ